MHLPKLRKSVLEEGGGALCVEGNIPGAVGAFGLRKSPKRSGPLRVGLSGPEDIVNGSNGSARGKKSVELLERLLEVAGIKNPVEPWQVWVSHKTDLDPYFQEHCQENPALNHPLPSTRAKTLLHKDFYLLPKERLTISKTFCIYI